MCNERATMVVGAGGVEFAVLLREHLVYAGTVVPTVDNALALCSHGVYGTTYVPRDLFQGFLRGLERERIRRPDHIMKY